MNSYYQDRCGYDKHKEFISAVFMGKISMPIDIGKKIKYP